MKKFLDSDYVFGSLGILIGFALGLGYSSHAKCQEGAQVYTVKPPITDPFSGTCYIGGRVSVEPFEGGVAIVCRCQENK